MNTQQIINRAKTSKTHLKLLNLGLAKLIPFNKPHRFKVEKITDHEIATSLPYRKSNLNHIKGIHACALATISEFTTGLLLLSRLDANAYRIILKTLTMDYHYQGKKDITAAFSLTDDEIDSLVVTPLKEQDSVDVLCEVKTYDSDGNHISTGKVVWQIKDWKKVKTKL